MNPFVAHDAALAAHQRMPAGTPHRLLLDDPESPEEIKAEKQRKRVAAAHRRARERAKEGSRA